MRRFFIVSIATLTATLWLAEDAAARDRPRTRIVIYGKSLYDTEPGTIYGYAPGLYLLGRNGVLYGPYPVNWSAPATRLRY